MTHTLDVAELLRTLARHRVEYVVIGGIAVQFHGHRRTTKDLDIVPAPDPANHERLAAALSDLDARPVEMPAAGMPAAEQLATAAIVPPLLTTHGELHIVNEAKGAAAYADLRKRATTVVIDGVELAIAGRDDVIAMKRASGRPEDLADIAALTHVERTA